MNPQSWNGYGYAWGNPMLYTDPSGMQVAVADTPNPINIFLDPGK